MRSLLLLKKDQRNEGVEEIIVEEAAKKLIVKEIIDNGICNCFTTSIYLSCVIVFMNPCNEI